MEKIISILGCPCHSLNGEEVVKRFLTETISKRRGGYSVAINAKKVIAYNKLKVMKGFIDNAALKSPDGSSVVIAARLLYGEKISKINLPQIALNLANEKGFRVFLLGAIEENNYAAYSNIGKDYPGIVLCGRLNGYFEDISVLSEALEKTKPDLVFVCMGSPRQEQLSLDIKEYHDDIFFIGCGGWVDFMAGKIKRAPEFMVNNALEWLYRLVLEPRRYPLLKDYIIFFSKLFIEVSKRKFSLK